MTKNRSHISPISVRLEPGWKRVLERLAKEDRRSASTWAEKVLIDHMKAQGFTPDDDQGEGDDAG
jgi:predicted transcriptional regulator